MTNKFAYIQERFSRPLMLTEEKATIIAKVFSGRFNAADFAEDEETKIVARAGKMSASDLCQKVIDDVAIIQIVGSLVHRGGWIGASSGLVSYQGIEKQLTAAESDPNIKTILFEFDSPGGEVAGVFDLAAKIKSCSKRTVAFANDLAASAAFLLASACDERHLTIMGRVGSIGVVTAHIDESKKLKKEGLKVTTIHAGEDKTEGWSHKPASAKFLKNRQNDVNYIYQLFTTHVAEGLNISQDEVVATNANVFTGEFAVEKKLADSVTTFDELITRLTSKQPLISGATEETKMSDPKAENAPNPAGVSDAENENAVVNVKSEERERIAAIVNCEEAQGRTALANHLAFNTDMKVKDAKEMLNVSTKETAKSESSVAADFQSEMAKAENQPNIAPENGANQNDNQKATLAQRVDARRKAHGGDNA